MTEEHIKKLQEGRRRWAEQQKAQSLTPVAEPTVEPAKSKPFTTKTMRKQLKELLSMPVINAAAKRRLSKLGITNEDQSNQMLLMIVLFQQGLQGDIQAIKLIDDMTSGGLTNNGNNITINLQAVQVSADGTAVANTGAPEVLPGGDADG